MPNREATLRLPCPTCSGARYDTHEDRHTGTNPDVCETCGGEGTILPRTGETPEASFQPAESAPEEGEGQSVERSGGHMPDRTVDGIRLGHVRRCACGRDPEISTAYQGQEPGFGPFVLKCYCGRDPNTPTPDDEHGIVLPTVFARSWVKSRGVKLWNRVARDRAATSPAE